MSVDEPQLEQLFRHKLYPRTTKKNLPSRWLLPETNRVSPLLLHLFSNYIQKQTTAP